MMDEYPADARVSMAVDHPGLELPDASDFPGEKQPVPIYF